METASELVPLPAGQRQFGRYHLLYRIGSGGMANLYLARFTGPDGFEKLVAIKRIHEHLSSAPTFLKMFKDEARLAARISHSHVVQVIELGQHQGAYYIAMEYVDGENLTALLNRSRLSLPIAARIIADASAGLHAAHELRNANGDLIDLVHRDLSPSNILIGYDGVVKVVDFGVARARGTLHITEAGMVKGKFAYMSPEQVSNRPLDRRSDIFSMGILLYESTTYSRLFRADSEAGSVAMIQSGKVPPPASRLAGYPPLLEKIVLRALEHDSGKRFSTANEMQLALEGYIYSSGSPVTASSVADLMRSVFSDRIAIKEQLLKSGSANPAVLPELEQSYSTLKLPGGGHVRKPFGDTPVKVSPRSADHEKHTIELEPLTPVPAIPPDAAAGLAAVQTGPQPMAPPSADAADVVIDLAAGLEELGSEGVDEETIPYLGAGSGVPEPFLAAAELPEVHLRVTTPPAEPGSAPEAAVAPAAVSPGAASVPGGQLMSEADIDGLELRSPLRRRVVIGAAALALVGTGTALFFALRPKSGGRRPMVAAPARSVEVTVAVTPERARILVDGQPSQNPCRLHGAAGSGGASLQISAPGFRSRELRVIFDRDQSIEIELARLAPDAGSTRAASTKPEVRRKTAEPVIKTKRPRPKSKAGSKGLFGNPYED